jgi:hypothetical protein
VSKTKDLFGLQRAVADAPAAAGVVGNLPIDDQILHYLLNRVTRHLRGALPAAEIVACDIHEQAVTFIEQELGVQAFQSQMVPDA